MTEIFLWVVMVATLIYGFIEVVRAWAHRPLVMYDERLGVWRAAPRVGLPPGDLPDLPALHPHVPRRHIRTRR